MQLQVASRPARASGMVAHLARRLLYCSIKTVERLGVCCSRVAEEVGVVERRSLRVRSRDQEWLGVNVC